jgi:2-haloacid dehalogenase
MQGVTGQATSEVKALVFDVFGTVVDWRSSVAAEVDRFAAAQGITLDGAAFADRWRAGYAPAMNRVRSGELPWTRLDALHRMILDEVLTEFGVGDAPETMVAFLNRAWRRLRPWPDAVAGLERLKEKFIIAPLSNGNIALMTELARFAGLPWDCVLGAELAQHYKPDPEVYRSACHFLDLAPSQVMMVAAHLGDLRAARKEGLATAFVPRPAEFGPAGTPEIVANGAADITEPDFLALAAHLGA